MNTKLIRMFKCEVPEGKMVSYKKVAKLAMEVGYIVDPAIATKSVMDFLKSLPTDLNKSFYKTWDDILDKTEEELLLDQLAHYASTYGTLTEDQKLKATLQCMEKGALDVQYDWDGNGYVPNTGTTRIPLKEYQVIEVATAEEVRDRILNMFASGIALKNDTIMPCIGFLKTHGFLDNVQLTDIKNKEARAALCWAKGTFPEDEFDLLRVIMWACTGEAMLIKDKRTINAIEINARISPKSFHEENISDFYDYPGFFNLKLLSDEQIVRLSKIFYRFKPLFLALKKSCDSNKSVVNKIRKLAPLYHEPLKKGFWEKCLYTKEKSPETILKQATDTVDELTNFKKVQILQAIRKRIAGEHALGTLYTIRNGTMFIRKDYTPKIDTDFLERMYNIVKDSLIKSLSKKATTYIVREGVHLTCPTSEKNFLGNYPMGTYVDFDQSDNVIGCYWREEWGARDIDLHVIDATGHHYGWNSHYKSDDQDVIYSGDMTRASPEATELFYFKQGVLDAYVNLHLFNGSPNSQYRLFVARQDVRNQLKEKSQGRPRKDHIVMVDPNNVVFEAMLTLNAREGETVAYIHDNKLHLMQLSSSQSRIPTKKVWNDLIQQTNQVQAASYVDLIPILDAAGFQKVETTTDIGTVGLNLIHPKKDDLINLFAN